MNSLAMNIGQRQLESAFDKTKAQLTAPKTSIDWNDFNWPPFLNIIHFKLSELKDPHLLPCRRLYGLFWLMVAHSVLNLVSIIIQVATGYSALRILASILINFILLVVAAFALYNGYRGICQDSSLLLRYKIATIFIILLHFPMWIANTLNFNGIVRADRSFSDGNSFAGVVCVIEIIYILLMDALMMWQLVLMFKWSGPLVNY